MALYNLWIHLTLLIWEGGAKVPYPSSFFKYLQNYSLNWLEIFRAWFSENLKNVLKKLLKIGVTKVLDHTLSWMTSYWKKILKFCFSFFFNNFPLFVNSMLCLLVKTILFESKCYESSEPRPFLDDVISKKTQCFYFVFFNDFSLFVISMFCLPIKTIFFP